MSKRLHAPIVPMRLWVNISLGKWFISLGIQHRIAFAPALKQTCHHSLLIRRGIHFSKEVI